LEYLATRPTPETRSILHYENETKKLLSMMLIDDVTRWVHAS
jgi:hypothetical protein